MAPTQNEPAETAQAASTSWAGRDNGVGQTLAGGRRGRRRRRRRGSGQPSPAPATVPSDDLPLGGMLPDHVPPRRYPGPVAERASTWQIGNTSLLGILVLIVGIAAISSYQSGGFPVTMAGSNSDNTAAEETETVSAGEGKTAPALASVAPPTTPPSTPVATKPPATVPPVTPAADTGRSGDLPILDLDLVKYGVPSSLPAVPVSGPGIASAGRVIRIIDQAEGLTLRLVDEPGKTKHFPEGSQLEYLADLGDNPHSQQARCWPFSNLGQGKESYLVYVDDTDVGDGMIKINTKSSSGP